MHNRSNTSIYFSELFCNKNVYIVNTSIEDGEHTILKLN